MDMHYDGACFVNRVSEDDEAGFLRKFVLAFGGI
jgi:hypothetical protein